MDVDTLLERVAAVLAVVVAGTHLYWALPQIARQLFYGQVHDPRPIAFLLTVVLILMGIGLVVQGFDPLPVYVGGIALMLVLLGGYVAWHTVLAHGAFWGGREPVTHDDVSQLYVVYLHLVHNPLEQLSKVAEALLLFVLSALAVRTSLDRRADETH